MCHLKILLERFLHQSWFASEWLSRKKIGVFLKKAHVCMAQLGLKILTGVPLVTMESWKHFPEHLSQEPPSLALIFPPLEWNPKFNQWSWSVQFAGVGQDHSWQESCGRVWETQMTPTWDIPCTGKLADEKKEPLMGFFLLMNKTQSFIEAVMFIYRITELEDGLGWKDLKTHFVPTPAMGRNTSTGAGCSIPHPALPGMDHPQLLLNIIYSKC